MKIWLVDGYIGWMAAAWIFILVLVIGNAGMIFTDFWELTRNYGGVAFSLCFAAALTMFTGFTSSWLVGWGVNSINSIGPTRWATSC